MQSLGVPKLKWLPSRRGASKAVRELCSSQGDGPLLPPRLYGDAADELNGEHEYELSWELRTLGGSLRLSSASKASMSASSPPATSCEGQGDSARREREQADSERARMRDTEKACIWRESWQVGEDLEVQASLSSSTRGRRPVSYPSQPIADGKVGPGKRLKRGLHYFYGVTFNNP